MKYTKLTDIDSYYQPYIQLVLDGDICDILEKNHIETQNVLRSIPADKGTFAYAEGKWTVNMLIGHMIDSERVFQYRSLCLARGEKKSLPGFDQNEYVVNSNFNQRTVADLADEFRSVRQSGVAMYRSLGDTEWQRSGTSNDTFQTVESLAYITAGHELHHVMILRGKYQL